MIVRCTAKARGLLDVRQLAEPGHSSDDWYVNLLWFDRRKCLRLAHVGTLFPVFVADDGKAGDGMPIGLVSAYAEGRSTPAWLYDYPFIEGEHVRE